MSTILQKRQAQDNVETSGAKCNRCAYDVTWNPNTAPSDFGKNRPYERDLKDAHECPKDENGNVIVRKGYQIIQTPDGKSKAVCIIPKPQQQQLQVGGTGGSVATAQTDAMLMNISNQIGALVTKLNEMVKHNNEEIAIIKGIVETYVSHNPVSTQLAELIDVLVKNIPSSHLKPKTADEL